MASRERRPNPTKEPVRRLFRCWGLDYQAQPGLRAAQSWGSMCRPTSYLLSCPAIEAGQFGQRRRGAIVMVIQSGTAGGDNVEEGQLARQELADRRLIGCVQHRAAGAALPRNFITQL